MDVGGGDGGDEGWEALVVVVAEAVEFVPAGDVGHGAVALLGAEPGGFPGGAGAVEFVGREGEHRGGGELDAAFGFDEAAIEAEFDERWVWAGLIGEARAGEEIGVGPIALGVLRKRG